MRALLLLVLAVGCGPWEPGAPVRAVGDDAWRAQVEEAGAIWGAALSGCVDDPFPVDDDGGMDVELISVARWPHADNEVGYTPTPDWVHVRGDSSEDLVDVIVHEFGHRLHLGHAEDRESVMHRSRLGVRAPSAADVANARRLLGCE